MLALSVLYCPRAERAFCLQFALLWGGRAEWYMLHRVTAFHSLVGLMPPIDILIVRSVYSRSLLFSCVGNFVSINIFSLRRADQNIPCFLDNMIVLPVSSE